MAITKDKGAIKKRSGGVWKLLQITDSGTAGTEVGADWLEMGYVESSQVKDETEIKDFPDESGKVVASDEGNRVVKITGTLMQTDKETIDFFTDTVRGKYYSVYHYDGINNGKHQEYVFAICRIKPTIDITSGVKRIPFEITVLKNEVAESFAEVGDGAGQHPELPTGHYAVGDEGLDAVVIPIGAYYTLKETAVS